MGFVLCRGQTIDFFLSGDNLEPDLSFVQDIYVAPPSLAFVCTAHHSCPYAESTEHRYERDSSL